jgi:hypothetical protein
VVLREAWAWGWGCRLRLPWPLPAAARNSQHHGHNWPTGHHMGLVVWWYWTQD